MGRGFRLHLEVVVSEHVKSAAEMALDAIAEACGCAEWEYPGQVVRDVLAVVKDRHEAATRLGVIERESADARRLGASIIKAQARAVEAERAAVVAWLRGPKSLSVGLAGIADAIAVGAHRTDDPIPGVVADLEARLAREENSHGLTIDQRDRAHAAADALAYAIGTVEDIGEHSNLNDPWANALELLELRLAHERAAGQADLRARGGR